MSKPSTFLSRWVFLRILGAIYLCAFVSLWTQVEGLIGASGILPAQDFLARVSTHFGVLKFLTFPTLFWLWSSDFVLNVGCAIGVLAGLLLFLNIAPWIGNLTAWLLYLSFVVIGQDFFLFQWDSLLIETGLITLFVAPMGLFPGMGHNYPPTAAGTWMIRLLLIKLVFLSGAVKLLSGDEAWKTLTALSYHFETQPLPTVAGWFAHQLPTELKQVAVAIMFAIELFLPLLIFIRGFPRAFACHALIGLQVAIAITGNYGIFNFLTIALCLGSLEDRFLTGLIPRRYHSATTDDWDFQFDDSMYALAGLVTYIVLNLLLVGGIYFENQPMYRITRAVMPLRLVNLYGLFAIMTTVRDEIIVEGSNNEKSWSRYEFKWKPGDPTKAPKFITPHMPRLDWQMWFAGLKPCEDNQWFLNFLGGLLEGRPQVLDLLAVNPFPEDPPKYIRTLRYRYRFTSLEDLRFDGSWWIITPGEEYCPTVFRTEENTLGAPPS